MCIGMNGTRGVQGWLMLPKDYDPSQKISLVVSVHGGPSAPACAPAVGGARALAPALPAMGYFALCPNPRGSYGQAKPLHAGQR